jgi:hypothetical protein
LWLAVRKCAHLSVGWAQKLAQSSGVNPSTETIWNWHTCGFDLPRILRQPRS